MIVGTSSDNGLQSIFEVGSTMARPPTGTAQKIENEVQPAPKQPVPTAQITAPDDAFLEDMQKRSFQYFIENTNPKNGLTLDRVGADGVQKPAGDRAHNIASIAASGFALSNYGIAAERGWMTKAQAREITRNTLDFFANRAFQKNGWFYHWMDYETGERRWNSEISSIDTALLLGGVLTAKQYFAGDAEIAALADKIYRRVDFNWMHNQRSISVVARLETGERIFERLLARLQRRSDFVYSRRRFADASDFAECVVRVGAQLAGIRRLSLSRRQSRRCLFTSIHTPSLIFATYARTASAVRQLF